MKNLSLNEEKMRDLYLRKLALGEIQGPPTCYESINKSWLKFYSEDQIKADLPHMSIYRYMIKNNINHMNDNALCYFGKNISFKKLDNEINKCVNSFLTYNIKPGDVVTICMPNTPEAVIAFYALNKMGAVANMIHPLSGEKEIKNYLQEVKSTMVITIDMTCEKILNVKDETNVKNIICVSPKDSMPFFMKKLYAVSGKNIKLKNNKNVITWQKFIKLGKKDEIFEKEYQGDRTSVIMHTGGTTGVPKGVELTDDNFNSMVEQFVLNADNFKRKDKMLTIMPVFHGFGLCSSIHLPLSIGVTSILLPKLDSKKMDKIFDKYKPNHIIGVPTLFKAMLNNKKLESKDLSYLKYVVSGGDLIKDSLENDINEFLKKHNSPAKLCKGYGLSEAVAGVTFADKDYNIPTSIGIPMVKTSIKIVDPETEKEVSNGDIGEICVNGPTTMKQYYNNVIETENSLHDGWLHTGDLGYCDNGIFYFAQRRGNMIISSGVNVYPSNIEKVLETHEAVATCAVIGIHHSYKMQVPKAYIILKEGYKATDELKEELNELCKKCLNVYSIPYSYEFREKLPQTLLGKINRKELSLEEEKVKIYKK